MHAAISRFAGLAAAALTLAAGVGALPKVSRQGRYLYSDDGTRFLIKGIAYQEQGAHRSLAQPPDPYSKV